MKRATGRALLAVSLCVWATVGPAPAHAHEFRPALLQLTAEDAPNAYDATFATPRAEVIDDRTAVGFPDDCDWRPRPAASSTTTLLQSASVQCEAPLPGRPITLPIGRHAADTIVQLRGPTGTRVERVPGGSASWTVPADAFAGAGAGVFGRYLVLGVEHILIGADHLLFVLGLVLLSFPLGGADRRGSARHLVATITGFTIGHSATLAAATLGWWSLPSAPVEACIALSIVYLAVEVLRADRSQDAGWGAQHTWTVAAGFGLLHGFGFSGVLGNLGLPEGAVPAALLAFNIGVELGQLAFVAALLALGAVWMRGRRTRPTRAALAYGMGAVAAFWVYDRTGGTWWG